MGSTPTITVYIPCYNQEPFLVDAIESVLGQTRVPDEIIVIDDASTDGSPGVIDRFARAHSSLMRVVRNEQNRGIGAVRAQAVELARGELITYLDGDDLFLPEKLELESAALSGSPEAGYAYSNFAYMSHAGEVGDAWIMGESLPVGDLFDRIACFSLPRGVCHRSELMRTGVVRSAGSYEHGLNLYEDYDLKVRVARTHLACAVDAVTQHYRQHPAGLSRAPGRRHYDTLEHIYRKNRALIDTLEPSRRDAVRAGIDRTLGGIAWMVVQSAARGKASLSPGEAWRYARAGMRHRPSSAYKIKNYARLARAVLRGMTHRPAPAG